MPLTIFLTAVKQKSVAVRVVSALLWFLLVSPPAWAWPPTYGAEFELIPRLGFFSQLMPGRSYENSMKLAFAKKINKRCAQIGCRIEVVKGKWSRKDYKVIYPDGWWFKISSDPGCVEITTMPSTLEVLESKKALINDHIFGTGQSVGLSVKPGGRAHFNIGIRSAFGDSAENFLRFFVDYANHADLALGSLGKDIANAPPLAMLKPVQRQALQQIVDEVRTGKLETIDEVAKAIEDRVYTSTLIFKGGSPKHYQAFGLKYVNRTDLSLMDAPFELRAMWEQDSAEKFNLIAKLMEARIHYTNQLKTPIIYKASNNWRFDPVSLKTRFFIYVEEAGLRYEDFETLLPEKLRNEKLDAFVDPSAPIELRLKNISRYWDILLTSEWARANFINLLDQPGAQHSAEGIAVLKRLAEELAQRSGPPAKSWLQKMWRSHTREITDAEFRENEIRRSVWQGLASRISTDLTIPNQRRLRCTELFSD